MYFMSKKNIEFLNIKEFNATLVVNLEITTNILLPCTLSLNVLFGSATVIQHSTPKLLTR